MLRIERINLPFGLDFAEVLSYICSEKEKGRWSYDKSDKQCNAGTDEIGFF